MIASWFQQSPISFSIAEILGLVVAPDDGPLLPAIFDGERLIRSEHRRGELRFDRLGPLVRDPIASLREEYFSDNALDTTAAPIVRPTSSSPGLRDWDTSSGWTHATVSNRLCL